MRKKVVFSCVVIVVILTIVYNHPRQADTQVGTVGGGGGGGGVRGAGPCHSEVTIDRSHSDLSMANRTDRSPAMRLVWKVHN